MVRVVKQTEAMLIASLKERCRDLLARVASLEAENRRLRTMTGYAGVRQLAALCAFARGAGAPDPGSKKPPAQARGRCGKRRP
jgi:hypothetical protein